MPSSTTANAPACSTAIRILEQPLTTAGVVTAAAALDRWPPMRCTLCGVSPMWAITGMSTRVIAAIVSATVTPPSSFTHSRTGLDQPDRALQRLLRTDLVAPERQVADDQRLGLGPCHHPHVVRHLVELDGDRAAQALDHHAERVADEERVHACGVQESREHGVVRGHHRDRAALPLPSGEVRDADLLAAGRSGRGADAGVAHAAQPSHATDGRINAGAAGAL